MDHSYTIQKTRHGNVLVPRSPWNQTYSAIFHSENCQGVYINHVFGTFLVSALDLEPCGPLQVLKVVQLSELSDLDKIELKELKVLSMNRAPKDSLDLSNCENLTELRITCKPGLRLMNEGSSLERLWLWNPREDLEEYISRYKRLLALGVVNGPMRSLEFLKNCQQLKSVHLQDCRKLEDISSISHCRQLLICHIESCSLLRNVCPLGEVGALKSLTLNGLKNIQTIECLRSAIELKAVHLGDSNVLDGKIKFLRCMPNLVAISFRDRRHYDVTRRELQEFGGFFDEEALLERADI